jgi:hypothetical protein
MSAKKVILDIDTVFRNYFDYYFLLKIFIKNSQYILSIKLISRLMYLYIINIIFKKNPK